MNDGRQAVVSEKVEECALRKEPDVRARGTEVAIEASENDQEVLHEAVVWCREKHLPARPQDPSDLRERCLGVIDMLDDLGRKDEIDRSVWKGNASSIAYHVECRVG